MGQAAASITGSLIGAYGAKQDRKNQRRAQDIQAESFRFHRPYLERSYDGGEGALSHSLDQGTYQGQTYADMNPYESAGLNFGGNMGMLNAQGAYDLAQGGQGFGSNYQDLYSSAMDVDRLGIAQNYALQNSSPLIQAAMRDDLRVLQENTLTGINQGASNTGNMNSSRAGVAEAVAKRGFDDRRADVTATINDQLVGRSLDTQNRQFSDGMDANYGLNRSYQSGIDNMGRMANYMVGAGRGFRDYQQGGFDDENRRFNEARDFPLQQQIAYQQGILGRAVTNSPQNPVAVTASPAAGALGGAIAAAGAYEKYFGEK